MYRRARVWKQEQLQGGGRPSGGKSAGDICNLIVNGQEPFITWNKGQDRKVQHRQWSHSMAHINIYKRHYYAFCSPIVTVFEISTFQIDVIRWGNIILMYLGVSSNRFEIFNISHFVHLQKFMPRSRKKTGLIASDFKCYRFCISDLFFPRILVLQQHAFCLRTKLTHTRTNTHTH